MRKESIILIKAVLSILLLDVGLGIYFIASMYYYIIFNHEGVDNPSSELLSMAEEDIGVTFPDDLHISRIEDKNDDWQSHRYDILRIYSNYTKEQWTDLLGDKPCGPDDNYWTYSVEEADSGKKDDYVTCLTLKSTFETKFRSELIVQSRENDKYRELRNNIKQWCGRIIILFFVLIPWIPWKIIFGKIRKKSVSAKE